MAASDDKEAGQFRALVLPLLGYLNRLAIALTGNRDRAEDLVQETVLRGLRYFDNYSGEDFRAWMAAIMRNQYRSTGPAAISTEDEWFANIPDQAASPEQSLVAEDNARHLRGLVEALPEALREVLVMREFGELSYAQIAIGLAIPVGTVMSRLSRARESLRVAWLVKQSGGVP